MDINTILTFYGYLIFFYSLGLILSYVVLLMMAYKYTTGYHHWSDDYMKRVVDFSPYTPGVSIVAPAYNEEITVVDNVHSLLQQDYPTFEVIIVNDGSKDKTLEKLIENFELVEVPYEYEYKVNCKPFKRLFKSTNVKYERLVVVDKENGGTKADAVNGGLNVVQYPYFINTDVDCILARDAIYHCIFPVLLDSKVIAVSGTMSMSNGCRIENGEIVDFRPPSKPLPLFQDLEYKRSFLVGKMGWSYINALPNVSGGYGLFDTHVAIAAGGYGSDSFAEDMDMLWRMIGYCCDFNRSYRVVQVPHTCCWTEGPSTLKVLFRQRVRWGRGLIPAHAAQPPLPQTGHGHFPLLLHLRVPGPHHRICGSAHDTLPNVYRWHQLGHLLGGTAINLHLHHRNLHIHRLLRLCTGRQLLPHSELQPSRPGRNA